LEEDGGAGAGISFLLLFHDSARDSDLEAVARLRHLAAVLGAFDVG
jgi:hypothetical protein